MSKFTIIEDCSPYYIRFTHQGLDSIVDYCKKSMPPLDDIVKFKHYAMPVEQAKKVLSMTPMSQLMPLQDERVSLFVTTPGLYYRAHKDGVVDRFSINYPIIVADDKCVTSWYSDDDLKEYPMDKTQLEKKSSRECVGFDPKKHKPLKSMTARPGECILFNTEIFHGWDNTASDNYRIVLTLRVKHPLTEKTYFEDAKKIIFG